MTLPIPLVMALALLAVAGCETVEGAGRDLQSAGEAITDEAQKVQAGN